MSRRHLRACIAVLLGGFLVGGLAAASSPAVAGPTSAPNVPCTDIVANFVQNCGFENANLAPWILRPAASGSLTSVGQPVSPLHFGNLVAYAASGPDLDTYQQTINGLAANTTYTVGYWINTNDTSNTSQFEVLVTNSTGSGVLENLVGHSAFTWTHYSDTFTTDSSGSAPVLSFAGQGGAGVYQLDDVSVTLGSPRLQSVVNTTPTADITAGGTASASVLVTGQGTPAGSVTFALYGPNDTICANTPVTTLSGVPLDSSGGAFSGGDGLTVAGTYHWVTSYGGDGLNAPGASPCAQGAFTVSPAGLDHLTLTPANATIVYGTSETYTAEGFDQYDNDLGPETGVTYSIQPSGACTADVCTGTTPGNYQISAVKAAHVGTTSLTISRAATSTTLVVSNVHPAVNQATTLAATVQQTTGATSPTGSVTFYDGGVAIGNAPVSTAGIATLSTTFGGGPHSLTAAYAGDSNYLPSTSAPPVPLTVYCDQTVTGAHASLVVTGGTTCLLHATVSGGISVAHGAVLDLENSTVNGSISAGSPAGTRICGTSSGGIGVTGATGLVRIGDPVTNCSTNTIHGGLTASGNHAGVIVVNNTITGSWMITNNTGTPVTVTGNHH